MEILKIENKTSKRGRTLEIKGEIFCVTTTQIEIHDLKEEEDDVSSDSSASEK